ncbi:MAG: FkbM family methyltransferase [Chitinophagaceae bacterium]|nr:FkbM family methyltransferase [Chitinophagaceae bacterium]MBL0334188.1 FkbM family methyltransferase [Chitinophagaceae bacterium]
MINRFSLFYQASGDTRQSFRFSRMRKKGNTIRKFKMNGYEIFLRPNEADPEVFSATFVKGYHRPPFKLGVSPLIIDLGSNIGLTLLDFAMQYPDAKLFGIEPDADNLTVCRMNCKQIADCTVTHGAVWKQDGVINYTGKDEQSYQVQAESFQQGTTPCITMETYLQALGNPVVDFLKMDIEGAEYAILLESDKLAWLKNIQMMMIEVHDTTEQDKETGAVKITQLLKEHGFEVYKSSVHWSALIAIARNKLTA